MPSYRRIETGEILAHIFDFKRHFLRIVMDFDTTQEMERKSET